MTTLMRLIEYLQKPFKRKSWGRRVWFATFLLYSIQLGIGRAAPPDLILFNGRIFTADGSNSTVEAVAILGERILAIGNSREIQTLAGRKTESLDLRGRVVVPGFNDAHFHHMPNPSGFQLKLPFPEPTWTEVLAALTNAVKLAPKGSWIFAEVGITVVSDPASTRAVLDRLAPEHSVLIHSWFGHGHIINSAAMKRLAITEEEPDPVAGRWEREPGTRRVNGKFYEYAGWKLFRRLEDSTSEAEMIESMHQLGAEAARFGVTTIQNMTYCSLDRYVKLLGKAKFPVRMRVIRWPATDVNGRDLKDGLDLPAHPRNAPLVTVSGTKWILDGSPFERGMAIRGEYKDRPGWSGALNFPESEIRAMLRETLKRHDQSLLHAPGDKTIEAVLNAMLAVDPVESHWPARRVRLEHGDGMMPDLIPLARRLGVIVVQNPTHFDPGVTPIFERFGRDTQFFPFRSLLEAGIPLALGSDGPMNPGLNLMFAVTHPSRPSEAITREQAVTAYTRGSAFAEFAEQDKGTLLPGKLADLAVLSQDIFKVPPPELPKTESVLTLVGGAVIYDAGVLGRKKQVAPK
jgi:predicted amidohydrolase YtcJ